MSIAVRSAAPGHAVSILLRRMFGMPNRAEQSLSPNLGTLFRPSSGRRLPHDFCCNKPVHSLSSDSVSAGIRRGTILTSSCP